MVQKAAATLLPRRRKVDPLALSTSHRQLLTDEITVKLRGMVHSGEWPLQHRIPSETDLAAALGVSRGTLREAIKALTHSGILEVRRGNGTFVCAISETAGAARRMYENHTEEHILEVWIGLYAQAARLAARNATADDVAALRALLRSREDFLNAADHSDCASDDWVFHTRVAQASGNPLLHALCISLGEVYHKCPPKQQPPGGVDGPTHDGRIALVDAIEAGNAELAVNVVTGSFNS